MGRVPGVLRAEAEDANDARRYGARCVVSIGEPWSSVVLGERSRVDKAERCKRHETNLPALEVQTDTNSPKHQFRVGQSLRPILQSAFLLQS